MTHHTWRLSPPIHGVQAEGGKDTHRATLVSIYLNPITVDVITHDVLAAVAAGHEVVDSARVLEA
ncbi:MAG: hypothetical protein ACHRXM_34020 [Isosphaerales bacterium]